MFGCLQASSTYAGTAAPLDPSARSSMPGFYPPMANSYGVGTLPSSAATFSTGVHTAGNTTHGQAPCSVRSFQSPTGTNMKSIQAIQVLQTNIRCPQAT